MSGALTNTTAEEERGRTLRPEVFTDDDLPIVPDSLVELSTRLAGGYQTSAPVKMPAPDELTVRLVNISLLQRLDELRGDAALLQSFLCCAVGGLLGFLTNVFTSNQSLDKNAWIFLTLLLGFAAVFGFLTMRASRRAETLRQKVFDEAIKRTERV